MLKLALLLKERMPTNCGVSYAAPKGGYGIVRFRHRESASRVSVGVMLLTFVAKTQSTPEQAECEGNALKAASASDLVGLTYCFTLNQ